MEGVGAGGGGGDNGRPQAEQKGFGQVLFGLLRMAIFWYLATQMFSSKKPSDPSLLMNNLVPKGEKLVSSFIFLVIFGHIKFLWEVNNFQGFMGSKVFFCLSFYN